MIAAGGQGQREVFITGTEDRERMLHEDEQQLHKPACEDIQAIHLAGGNNASLNKWLMIIDDRLYK